MKGIPYFSLKIGDYRVIIDWRREQDILWVVTVGHRKNIYEKDL
ncbi:MAG: type II toxin-antitoxin system RelE/ParE family toxin [Candidatus Thermoplasmatota archaeon]|nr:type II toxin-antitoxin system RelE/ParE family toxin [Candidatus Thermoplasmatota archaeon]